MTVRSRIVSEFDKVARENDKRLAALTDDLLLLNSGLDSLCFAVVVVRLEESLGVDPFSASDDVVFPSTFGEFVGFYENATR
jgi:hypothetical protein